LEFVIWILEFIHLAIYRQMNQVKKTLKSEKDTPLLC